MFRSVSLTYPRSMRIRPSAPPLRFWKSSASTTCSRLTLPIFVSTRPIGRPWSWSIGGMPWVGIGTFAGGAAPAPAAAPAAPLAPLPPRFAGWPTLFGGALAPTEGALGVVRPGFCAGIPAPAAGWRCGLDDPGLGCCGIARDIRTSVPFPIADFPLPDAIPTPDASFGNRQSASRQSQRSLLGRQRGHARAVGGDLGLSFGLAVAVRRRARARPRRRRRAPARLLGLGEQRVVLLGDHHPVALHAVDHAPRHLALVDRLLRAD